MINVNISENLLLDLILNSQNIEESENLLNQFITEANIRRLDRTTQMRLNTIRKAIWLAKQNNDPLYIKYDKYRDLKKKFKDIILRKYGGQAHKLVLKDMSDKK